MSETPTRLPPDARVIAIYRQALCARRPGNYLAHARRWYASGRPALARGDAPTSQDVAAYVARARQLGRRDSTTAHELAAISRMYRCVGAILPAPPPLDTAPASSAALDADLIAHLVRHAREAAHRPLTRAWLCVATLYGPRVNELCRLDRSRVDLRAGRILIPASKGSRERWQAVPPSVAWALHALWHPCSVPSGCGRFRALVSESGADHQVPPGVGWHAIRHGLARAFRDAGVPPAVYGPFMRWAPPRSTAEGAPRMAVEYPDTAVVLGVGGARRQGAPDADRAAWANHPFLRLWAR